MSHLFYSHLTSSVLAGFFFGGWGGVGWVADSSVGKEFAWNAGDTGGVGSIPGSGRFPGVGNGNPLQYSCLENPTDTGACQAAFSGVAKSET